MAKQKIDTYIFQPGIPVKDNRYPNAYELIQNNVEFILTSTIYTNKNKVINDNLYEYDDIAEPFLAKLSRAIYKELED